MSECFTSMALIRNLQKDMTDKERKNENQRRWITNHYDEYRKYQADYQRKYMRNTRGWKRVCVELGSIEM